MKTIRTKVAGVTHQNEDGRRRQTIIKKLVEPGEVLVLRREITNQYDPNAIAVYVIPLDDPWDDGEYQIGYLQSDLAADLAPLADSGHELICEVLDVTGGDEGKETRGVNIEIDVYTSDEIAAIRQRLSNESRTSVSKQKPTTFWGKLLQFIKNPKYRKLLYLLAIILLCVLCSLISEINRLAG